MVKLNVIGIDVVYTVLYSTAPPGIQQIITENYRGKWRQKIFAGYSFKLGNVGFKVLAQVVHLVLCKSYRIINVKLVLSLVAEIIVFSLGDLESNQQLGLMVPTISSVVGLGTALGVLGSYYSKVINPCFRFLWWSTLILIPSAFFQALKINIHP